MIRNGPPSCHEDSARYILGAPAVMPKAFSVSGRVAGAGSSGNSDIKCLTQEDMATCNYAHLTTGT
jgi:hypothetical protein